MILLERTYMKKRNSVIMTLAIIVICITSALILYMSVFHKTDEEKLSMAFRNQRIGESMSVVGVIGFEELTVEQVRVFEKTIVENIIKNMRLHYRLNVNAKRTQMDLSGTLELNGSNLLDMNIYADDTLIAVSIPKLYHNTLYIAWEDVDVVLQRYGILGDEHLSDFPIQDILFPVIEVILDEAKVYEEENMVIALDEFIHVNLVNVEEAAFVFDSRYILEPISLDTKSYVVESSAKTAYDFYGGIVFPLYLDKYMHTQNNVLKTLYITETVKMYEDLLRDVFADARLRKEYSLIKDDVIGSTETLHADETILDVLNGYNPFIEELELDASLVHQKYYIYDADVVFKQVDDRAIDIGKAEPMELMNIFIEIQYNIEQLTGQFN